MINFDSFILLKKNILQIFYEYIKFWINVLVKLKMFYD